MDSSDWSQVAMIGLNIVPLALEAAPEEAALESEVNIPFYGVGSDVAANAGASAPMTGSQWYQYFSETYGKQNVAWISGGESGIWDLGNQPRGLAIESLLGGNLRASFRVIDQFDYHTGTATSIKSINLNAPTYQNASSLTSTVNGYVDSVAGFNGADFGGVRIEQSDITAKQLNLAIPVGSASPAQQSVINAAVTRAQNLGVNLIVTPTH